MQSLGTTRAGGVVVPGVTREKTVSAFPALIQSIGIENPVGVAPENPVMIWYNKPVKSTRKPVSISSVFPVRKQMGTCTQQLFIRSREHGF